MTNSQPAEPLAYHRLNHVSARHRWWRPLVGALVVIAGWTLALLLLDFASFGWGVLNDSPESPDGLVDFGPVAGTAMDLLYVAAALPVVLLAVRWIGRRPAGTVSSVTGRPRWRWLGLCLLVAAPLLALATAAMLLLPGEDGSAGPAGWAGWGVFAPAMAMLLVLVPLQSAAEEYLFRGWLLQAVGGFFRSPWFAVLTQSALFAVAHGLGTPWGFADLVVVGLLAGWLTVRTGGLEAAVALHVVNNLVAFGLAAATVGGLNSDDTAADASWQVVAIDLLAAAAYTAVVLRLARRRALARTAPAPVPAPLTSPAMDRYAAAGPRG